MIRITDGTREYVVSDDDQRAAESAILDLYEWVVNAVSEVVRRTEQEQIGRFTKLAPHKLTPQERKGELKKMTHLRSGRQLNELAQEAARAGHHNYDPFNYDPYTGEDLNEVPS